MTSNETELQATGHMGNTLARMGTSIMNENSRSDTLQTVNMNDSMGVDEGANFSFVPPKIADDGEEVKE
jgi:hypothetical protein